MHSVVGRWLGLGEVVDSGRSAVRGLSVHPQGHGHQEIHQFLTPGVRAGFVPLDDKQIYWFLVRLSPKGTSTTASQVKVVKPLFFGF